MSVDKSRYWMANGFCGEVGDRERQGYRLWHSDRMWKSRRESPTSRVMALHVYPSRNPHRVLLQGKRVPGSKTLSPVWFSRVRVEGPSISCDSIHLTKYDPFPQVSPQSGREPFPVKFNSRVLSSFKDFSPLKYTKEWGAFDSAKNHKRQRRKRQSVTAKREKAQTPKFV